MRVHQDGFRATALPSSAVAAGEADARAGHDPLGLHERERTRLAFDLHDGPAQALAAALLQVRLLQDGPPSDMAGGLAELQQLLASALDEMYELIEHLRCRAPQDAALADQVTAQVDAFTRRWGVPVALSIQGESGDYSQSLRLAVCRVVEEALTNIARHAAAEDARVDLVLGAERVECTIQDDGRGFDLEAVRAASGARDRLGIDGMRERAALLEGECLIESTPGRGTRIALSVPVWRAR